MISFHTSVHLTISRNSKIKIKPSSCRVSPRMSVQQNPSSILSNITTLLWGQSIPPQLLISTARFAWTSTWRLMMSQLAPSDPSGGYTRPASQFRANFNSSQYSLKKSGSLHLYVSLPCPWAHRTLIVRALKGFEEAIPISIASPGTDGLWEFKNIHGHNENKLIPGLDNANGCKTLKEVYRLRRGGYDGRSTVPMLWDVNDKEVVCNESYDIIMMLNSDLNVFAQNPQLDLYPPSLKGKIEDWNSIIYRNVNNGVYRCGFAQSQEAYDTAVNDLFDTLEMLNDHLLCSRYLCGDTLTLADVCLFTTLVRFDPVYNVLFKCTKKKLVEYPNLHGYMRDIYQIPKVAETCNFAEIMDGYYRILFPLNPGGIRPIIPLGCAQEALLEPHHRESLSSANNDMNAYIS